MIIRKATIKDLKAITAVEATCFPPAQKQLVGVILKNV